ncbi:hypothetical protein [Streptococcus suis]|uniref:hypothetical protein n=1 Tax=Streptococcus suis TaxID=1307 RepID=UPI001ABDA8B3|nr:hypothetical protein [Streptococcus suis]
MNKLNRMEQSHDVQKLKEIYRQTYLEHQVGDVVEFVDFGNFRFRYEEAFSGSPFEVFHPLEDGATLKYDCRFQDFETAKALYESLDDLEGTKLELQLYHLNLEKVEIMGREILKP